ncbi:MAG TPA: hypothetical protein VGO00_28335, partial [Kofleriaceae bacterium]|nr:hypothetical protein [Kofleriaceae bacterium]
PVISALDELWQLLPALTGLIDNVTARFRRLSWFKPGAEIAAIQELLEGESVTFTTKTTYAQRGLLTPDEVTRAMTPERVLRAMIEAYDMAKAVVVEVGEVSRRLPGQLDDAARDLPDLAPRIAAIRDALANDPLSAAHDYATEIEPALATAKRRITAAREDASVLTAEMFAAESALASLRSERDAAAAVVEECRAKIALAQPPPYFCDAHVVDELAAWLRRLADTLHDGRGDAARVGITSWSAQLHARRDECATALHLSRALLDRRRELRGLLDGFHAKAQAIGCASQPALAELHRRAHTLLHSRPTPLDEAEKLVDSYRRGVR